MSGKGFVTTARGEALNLDEMIAQAKRPIGYKEPNSEVAKRKVPNKKIINISGFVPAAPTVLAPEVPEEIKAQVAEKKPLLSNPTVKASFHVNNADAPSMADLTGIRLEKATFVRPVKEGEVGVDPKALAEQTIMSGIMGGLQQVAPVVDKAEKTRAANRSKLSKNLSAEDADILENE